MDMLGHLDVISNKQLKNIYGGINISGTLVKAFSSAIGIILDVGRSFGTAIRRVTYGKLCSF